MEPGLGGPMVFCRRWEQGVTNFTLHRVRKSEATMTYGMADLRPKDEIYRESDSNVVLVGQLVKPPRI